MAELGLEKVNTRVPFSSTSWLKKRASLGNKRNSLVRRQKR